jgi:hypothetical protein
LPLPSLAHTQGINATAHDIQGNIDSIPETKARSDDGGGSRPNGEPGHSKIAILVTSSVNSPVVRSERKIAKLVREELARRGVLS